MSVMTIEGIVENGGIRLPAGVHLPEKARVYVVVPSVELSTASHVPSPRLVHREQAADFVKEVVEDRNDASV